MVLLQASTDQWNRKETWTDSNIYGHLIYYTGVSAEHDEDMSLSRDTSGSNADKHVESNETWSQLHLTYTIHKITFRWVVTQCKGQTEKLLEDNKRERYLK